MAEVEILSPWWRRSAIVVIVLALAVPGYLAKLAYSDAPPIPERAVSPDGLGNCSANADIALGQQVFLRYGLMENGTIWGHGAYLGPDFSADEFRTLALDTEKTVAERQGFVMQTALLPNQRLIVNAEVARLLKRNRYDPASKTLTFTEAEAASYRRQIGLWAKYVLNEIALALIGPLEADGYTLPESMWPDISQGKIFSNWLRTDKGLNTDDMPSYTHVFEDGRKPVLARAYPNPLLADFREHFTEVWLRKHAEKYFADRDDKALEYLPRLLPTPKKDPKRLG